MIDGIKIHTQIDNFQEWKNYINIPFGVTVLDTGEIKSKVRSVSGFQQRTFTHRANFQTYLLQVKEVERKRIDRIEQRDYFLTLEGSLHKNHFNSENYSRFGWDHLQSEILLIQNDLQIPSDRAKILNIEFGVNIPLPFEVFPFLKRSIISHKGKPFNQYRQDRCGFVLGYVCDHSQYSVKIYDKGKQFNLPDPLMRFELRFTKMQKLKKYGIRTLTDLRDWDKVKKLIFLLLLAWSDILLYDQSVDHTRADIRPFERDLLNQGNSPKFWENLKETNLRRFNSKREQYKTIVRKYGNDLHGTIGELIKNEWENLFSCCTNLPSVHCQ